MKRMIGYLKMFLLVAIHGMSLLWAGATMEALYYVISTITGIMIACYLYTYVDLRTPTPEEDMILYEFHPKVKK